MKLAKQEADKEIGAYRAETDQKFAQWEREQAAAEGSMSVQALTVEADKAVAVRGQCRQHSRCGLTHAPLQQMGKDVEANWTKVADMLVEVVTRVEMKIPEARKGVEQG